MNEVFGQLVALAGENMLNLLTGLLILVVGWIIARVIKAVVYRLMKKTNVDNRLAGSVSDGDQPAKLNVEKWVSIAVYYLVMLFVLVAFFQAVELPAVAAPLNAMLEQIAIAAPQLLGAALILLLAWLVATVAKFIVRRTMSMTKLDEKLAAQADIEKTDVNVVDSLANGVFWLVFLLFLPAVLGALGMQGLVEPVTGVVDTILGAIPNIFAAGLSLFIGWLVARIVRQIVVNLLAATNINSFGERIGVSGEKQSQPLSQIIGSIVYILILIPAVITALKALGVAAIADPAVTMLTTVMNAIPLFFGAAIVLLVSYFAGKLVSGLVSNLLAGVGFDRLPELLGFKDMAEKSKRSLSEVVGYLVLVIVMVLASIEAADMLGFVFLADMLSNLIGFAVQVLLALVVFAIGLYLANLTRDVIVETGGKNAGFMAGLARSAILVFVAAMALQQIGVAGDVVNLAFGIFLGAIGVAAALAFGLGSRETAGKLVDEWVNKFGDDE